MDIHHSASPARDGARGGIDLFIPKEALMRSLSVFALLLIIIGCGSARADVQLLPFRIHAGDIVHLSADRHDKICLEAKDATLLVSMWNYVQEVQVVDDVTVSLGCTPLSGDDQAQFMVTRVLQQTPRVVRQRHGFLRVGVVVMVTIVQMKNERGQIMYGVLADSTFTAPTRGA